MNNDVEITLYNKTPYDYTMVVFQQDPEIDGMFTKIFPTAWQQIPLGGLKAGKPVGGNVSCDTFVYPIQMQVGICESNTPYSPNTRTTTYDCLLNSKWKFSIENGYQKLELLDAQNTDGTISCYNDSTKRVEISICKNSKPLLRYTGQDGKGVPQGEVANLQITPKIYIMYASQMLKEDYFNSYVSSNEVVEVDLTNAKKISVSLTVKDEVSGLKEWVVEKTEN